MTANLQGKKVAMLVADGFEQVELTSPRDALINAGATVEIVSPNTTTVMGWNHFQKGDRFPVDVPLADANADSYDALVLPGGVANPDQLRAQPEAVDFVRKFFDQQKPVAAICHGPWTLINAGVVEGRKMTSYHSISLDLRNAGAKWVDQEVVVDDGLITSRSPDDLEAFNAKVVEEIGEGIHAGQHA